LPINARRNDLDAIGNPVKSLVQFFRRDAGNGQQVFTIGAVDKAAFNIGQGIVEEAHHPLTTYLLHPYGMGNTVNRVDMRIEYSLMGVNQVDTDTVYFPAGEQGKTQRRHETRKRQDRYMVKLDRFRAALPTVGEDMHPPAMIGGDSLGQFVDQLFAAAH
jgi:hypothetical protein